MIGNILVRHRKIEIFHRSQSSRQIEQEGCDTTPRTPAHQQSVLLGTPKFVRCGSQQETCNSTVMGGDGQQGTALEIQHQCIGRCLGGKRMFQICPAKQLSRQIKARDAAGAALKGSATADDPIHDQENVIGRVPFAHDDLVPMVTDRAASKGNNGALHQFLVLDLQEWVSNRRPYGPVVQQVFAQRRAGSLDHLEVGHFVPPNSLASRDSSNKWLIEFRKLDLGPICGSGGSRRGRCYGNLSLAAATPVVQVARIMAKSETTHSSLLLIGVMISAVSVPMIAHAFEVIV